MSCKVGNQTNSQDPQAVNSRVFVGNLNTFQCSKTDVERSFQRYGRIAGISMHKGYAFIQFTNPFDARSACLGEDGRLIWGQTLDVNMVAEPKSHQTGRKRQNIAKTGNDWDYYYDSYYAQVGLPPGPRLVPPMKRPRIHGPTVSRPPVKAPSPNKSSHLNNNSTSTSASLTDLKTYSTPDILICGNCREHFSEVEQLIEHKKTYCKLRFTCKCHLLNGSKISEEPAALLCSQCKDSFSSAWDLMVHVQAAHMLNIYQLSSDPSSGGSSRDQSETREFKHMSSMIGDGIPNGLNPNGTLLSLGDSLMEDSHCQTDLSSTSSSASSSIMSGNGNSLVNSLHQQQQQQQQQHHQQHHSQHQNQNQLQNNQQQQQQLYNHRMEQDSTPTMTDVSTSTGLETMGSHHVIMSSSGGNNNNCLVVDNGNGNSPSSTATSASSTMTNNNQSLMNGNDALCSSSQCSTSSVNGNSSFPLGLGGIGLGQLHHNNFMNNNNTNSTITTSASTSNSTSPSSFESSSSIVSQPMEASTQTQTVQVGLGDSNHHQLNLLHPENNNINNNQAPAANNAANNIIGNGGGGGAAAVAVVAAAGGAIPSNFDEHCSIVSTLKQEGTIHLPFSNGQVASM